MNSSHAHALRPGAGLTVRKGIIWAVGALLAAGVALFSYRYVPGIGIVAPLIVDNTQRHPWLVVHVAGAATALLLGPLQFLPRLRARYRTLHRWIGRTYAVSCLVGGAAGLMLALGTSTGRLSTVGFGLLAVIWTLTTATAWRYALKRNFVEHRRWMIRSFVLTLAAVTLRLYLPVAELLPVPIVDSYRVISFLCWIPNLIVAELYLRATARGSTGTAA
jgi:uncharacterized membrane protein